jgi:5-methylthioadenosine/S-adenosylhomocysteine deaminase
MGLNRLHAQLQFPRDARDLLGELKVASLVSAAKGNVFTSQELVAMATCDAARILNWDRVIGSIEQGKRADLLVIDGTQNDPYIQLISALETDISLVLIDGVRRYGRDQFMGGLDQQAETWNVGGQTRMISLAEDNADVDVGAVTLRQAWDKLADGLNHLPELARMFEHPSQFVQSLPPEPTSISWSLVLDHDDLGGVTARPHLPYKGRMTAMPLALAGRAEATSANRPPLSQELQPETLDRLTVADDKTFLDRLGQEVNLPNYLKAGLPGLF